MDQQSKDALFNTRLETLFEAFFDDPFYVYLTPDRETRKRNIKYYLSIVLKYGMRYGNAICSQNNEAVSLWCGPETPYLETTKLLSCGLWQAPFRLNPREVTRALHSATELEKAHNLQPKQHYYLLAIGTKTQFQGKGMGSQLLKPVLERASTEGQVCYLETANPRNVPWYETMGFKVTTKIELTAASRTGCTYWAMKRQP